jgi:pimeloyl-ACP methyl ester carboxylesterase
MNTSDDGNHHVVLVHGLWFGAWAMSPLARYLRREGFSSRAFGYSSTHQDLHQQSEDLLRFASEPDGALPHIVAHSMGGLITLQMLANHPGTPSGRIVLLGSPVRGSSVARRLSRWPGGQVMLGAAKETLVRGADAWPRDREIGMIAGTR